METYDNEWGRHLAKDVLVSSDSEVGLSLLYLR